MTIQLIGFSYSASKTFSFIPQENLQEELHKHCEAKQLIEDQIKFPQPNMLSLKTSWPEQFLKDSIVSEPNTPPPRHILV